MKIFISWSGKRSHAVAEALHDWLSRVIQAVEPFFTPYMEKGVKWSNEIDAALEGTHFGIVCLTPDNLHSDWILFETGALSKTNDAVIWTFLHGLAAGDVPQPLGKFQHTIAEKKDVLKLLHSINLKLREVGVSALKDSLLEDIFEENWSKFEAKLKDAESLTLPVDTDIEANPIKIRDEKDVLNEILEAVRNQQRQIKIIEDKIENHFSASSKTIFANALLEESKPFKKNLPEFFDAVQFFIIKTEHNTHLTLDFLESYLKNIIGNIDFLSIEPNSGYHTVNISFEKAINLQQLFSLQQLLSLYFGNAFAGWKVAVYKKDDEVPF